MTRYALLPLAALLAGCQMAALPDLSAPAPAAPAVEPPAERAIAACLERAEAQGLEVRGVASADEVVGGAGTAVGQNVFLQVRRGGQAFELRCNYSYAAEEARIMTL